MKHTHTLTHTNTNTATVGVRVLELHDAVFFSSSVDFNNGVGIAELLSPLALGWSFSHHTRLALVVYDKIFMGVYSCLSTTHKGEGSSTHTSEVTSRTVKHAITQ